MVIHSLIKLIDETIVFPYRFNYLTTILIPYLKGNKLVLDIGASEGRLAQSIKNKTKIDFIGVDKHVQPKTSMPIKKYDGGKLPFKNNTFDCVILIDVLHHTIKPLHLLKESRRVSREFVLIKDHYWDNNYDFTVLKIADWFGNNPYGVDLPYNYLSMQTWKTMFEKTNLSIIKFKKFNYGWFDLCKHVVFKLEKTSI